MIFICNGRDSSPQSGQTIKLVFVACPRSMHH